MEPSPELIDSIYLEKVLRARQTPHAEKFLDGAELFEYARTACEMGIRMQHPGASPERVRELFRGRLSLGRQLENMR